MIEKSTRTFVGIFAVLILFTSPYLSSYHPALATSSTGILVPLYSYPGTYWTQVIQAKNAHPSVPIVAIINPNNGPGSSFDSNYLNGIQQLQAAGVTVLGYVYTSYGARSTSSIEADINTYNNWYHVTGINFDEMSNVAGFESYYSNLSSYAKSLGMTLTVGNPGTDTLSSYVGTVDVLSIYENPGLPTTSDLGGWHTSYPKSNFAFISFGVSSLPTQSTITTDSNYVAYMYITNDVLPNPYDTVPSYLTTEAAMLDTGSGPTAPGTPTGLAATTASSSQINLSWTAPSNNGGSAITGYKIESSTNGGTTWSTIVSNTGSTSTTYSNTGLTASTTYTYRVSAINSVGTGSPSNTASATTSATVTVPQPPTGLAATAASSSQINLSWTAPSNNGGSAITGYNVYRGTTSGGEGSTPIATGITSTTYTDTGLTSGQTYYYVVKAVNSVGTSSSSNEANATPAVITAPGTPTGLAATTASSSQINLSWTAPANNGGSTITGNKIERSTDGGTTWSTVVSNTGSTGTTYSDTGLTANTTYTYRVSAINSVGTGSPSNTASATTGATVTVPQPPTGLAATTASSSQINLSWTAPSNNGGSAITGYKIERSSNGGSTWSTVVANTGNTGTTYSDTGLAAKTTYTYRVSAINSVGTGSPSNTASATTSGVSKRISITVNSVDLTGTPFTGMWIELHSSSGTLLATGYTTVTFSVTSGTQYTIAAANYQNIIFNHWSTGSTSSSIPVSTTKSITLTAYYSK